MSNDFGTDVPDSIRQYLSEIADRLWAGHAAIMVGSGFSKNAGREFPDWNQLGDLLYQKAYGKTPDSNARSYLNVLQLAEEVQAVIGRPALENMLRSEIPDLTVEPSSLHVRLLELPWVDVFTTNYDTLLERASTSVVNKRYEPVVNKGDIPYASKPRIVKLHGSFPSERPFIVTEEDYRRYPHDFAPFVNTVQQALLENTFCLIGFSGDDPNFLQWIGWIRDNLGTESTQKIYLVGVFDLSPAKLQLLAQRGVIVVDLSCCGDIDIHEHKKGLNKFIDYMKSKEPVALDWGSKPSKMSPGFRAARNEEIQKIVHEWQKQRHSYPGWLILPHQQRSTLWLTTKHWVLYLPDPEQPPLALDIQYAYELLWRLERCLIPIIFNGLGEFLEGLLKKYWPFRAADSPEDCTINIESEELHELPWNNIKKAWLAIALSMLRFYREDGALEKWKVLKGRLDNLSEHLTTEQVEFLHYEGILFSLFSLDLPETRQRLEEWRPNESQPHWMAKRAAVLAEIGMQNEAKAMVRDALVNIRKKQNQKTDTSDFSLVSQESYAMLLDKYIAGADSITSGPQDVIPQYSGRWDALKKYKCDPWNELKIFELILSKPPVPQKYVTEKREFDIGRITQTCHFMQSDEEVLYAYASLRFFEEAGLPFRIGNHTLSIKEASASLQRISRYSPFWATATLVRLGKTDAVDSLFNRESVYRVTRNEADQLIQNYLDALSTCQDDIRAGNAFRRDNYCVNIAQVLPEVISRLCCKCSMDTKHRILAFITELYASSAKNNYGILGNLTRRLIQSMSDNEQYSLVPELLKIPFPEHLNVITEGEFPNPFLLLSIEKKPECSQSVEVPPGVVTSLFQQAAQGQSLLRRWATSSLIQLYNLQLLNADQEQNLAEVLWRRLDSFGLPEETVFLKFVFLRLPHPKGIDPNSLFKAYVRETPFPVQGQGKSIGMTGGNIPLVHEIIGANKNDDGIWTTEDAIGFLTRLLEWWDADKGRLREEEREPAGFTSILGEFKSRFACITALLAEIVGPKLGVESSDDIKASLSRLLKEMGEYGLPVLEAEAACLHIYPEDKLDVCARISEALISGRKSIERDGLMAIAKIILSGKDVEECNDDAPVTMLSQYITWCPARSIALALSVLLHILENNQSFFSGRLERATLKRLDKLLIETAYENDDVDLTFDEKLVVRQATAHLTATLWEHNYQSVTVPPVIERWREICLSDEEFSEIRNIWNDCGQI